MPGDLPSRLFDRSHTMPWARCRRGATLAPERPKRPEPPVPPMTALQIALFLVCAAVATCAQTLTGFAFALTLLGLAGLLDLAPLGDLVNVASTLSLASAVAALRRSGGELDRPALRDITLGSLAGIVGGVLVIGYLGSTVTQALRALLGLTVMACAVNVLMRRSALAERSSPASFRAWGLVSGVLTGLFSAGGPPLVYQLYRQPLHLNTVRTTLVAALAASSFLRLATVLASGHFSATSLRLCLMAAPVVFGLGEWLRRHPPAWTRDAVLRLVCALLLFTGAGLLGPALVQMIRH